MNRLVNAIAGRLSLRAPQREALEILARVVEIAPPGKEADPAQARRVIRSEFPQVTDFERDFPSLCFALATGVGKTRLMGAFISYLHLARGIQHFFVLAPNLTIYNKLIADFTPNTPKYVFQGIAEFATNPPEIITGENYASGRGVRPQRLPGFGHGGVHVNIFNISKINSEVRGGRAPRIRKLSEYIGQSYFDYLAELDDLVLLMDESHRYRASAGVRAINELRPILGLELTATPWIEAGGAARSVSFQNVIYSYPLANALADGFVKEPAVATRENFNPAEYTEAQLERVKLEDGLRLHEHTKVELEVYARQRDLPAVKPFLLVVAQDTDHADALVATIKSDTFFEGRYQDRVITVHSNQRGDERDETVERLLSVEDPSNPTEIVVHVNMLKEGWDVTNLYTIVPLRAANSRTLVEQSIGRGLRLPYGRRTGVPAIDRLTIVAHDRFQAIIDEANNPNSIIRTGVVIGVDIPLSRPETVIVPPVYAAGIEPGGDGGGPAAASHFGTPAERQVAAAALAAIRGYEHLPGSAALRSPEIQTLLRRDVEAAGAPATQTALPGLDSLPDTSRIVAETVEAYITGTIDIPRIVVVPTGEVTCGYHDFDLEAGSIALQPVAQDVLIHHLRTNARERLTADGAGVEEARPEDYLVRALIDYDDICYDEQADLLYKLAGQMVAHLRSYLPDEAAVVNVLSYHQRNLAGIIHAQLRQYAWERAAGYEAHVSRGFQQLRPVPFSAAAGNGVRDFRAPVDERHYIRGILFGGFARCLYPIQKFDSDAERRFALILEDDRRVRKWLKPAHGQFVIDYQHGQTYLPDFVVETDTAKFLAEVKRANQLNDPDVLAKARAAITWCARATDHEVAHGGKPWQYLLIPHDQVLPNRTMNGLAGTFARSAAS